MTTNVVIGIIRVKLAFTLCLFQQNVVCDNNSALVANFYFFNFNCGNTEFSFCLMFKIRYF